MCGKEFTPFCLDLLGMNVIETVFQKKELPPFPTSFYILTSTATTQ